jgi:glutaredoxin-related protein
MTRETLAEDRVHASVLEQVGGKPEHRQTLEEVKAAISQHDVVIIGMAQNPFPKKARRLLDEAGISFHYLEYGSYFSEWHRRGMLKMWSGWLTFPMVFVKGVLVGGFADLQALHHSGELSRMLETDG